MQVLNRFAIVSLWVSCIETEFNGFGLFCFCISAQINIALNRPASQSSTYRSHVASKAVDGNAVGDSCSITGGGDYQPWWKVELAIAYWITHVELTNRRYSGTWRYELKYYIINSFPEEDVVVISKVYSPNTCYVHDMMTSSNGNISSLLAICAGNSPVPVIYPHKGQWRGAFMFSLICVWTNGWDNNREAGDLRRYRAHYDVIVMSTSCDTDLSWMP